MKNQYSNLKIAKTIILQIIIKIKFKMMIMIMIHQKINSNIKKYMTAITFIQIQILM